MKVHPDHFPLAIKCDYVIGGSSMVNLLQMLVRSLRLAQGSKYFVFIKRAYGITHLQHTQQTWSGFSPTTVPDNNRQSGFSPTTVPKLSTGYWFRIGSDVVPCLQGFGLVMDI